jgi:Icc-related predicted phosphoesterase
MTQLLLMSDIHCQWKAFSPETLAPGYIDGVIIAGDITNYGQNQWYEAYGFFEEWRQYLNNLAGTEATDTMPIMWIGGNHDFGAKEFATKTQHLATFVQDQLVQTPWDGRTIRGFNLSTCFDLPLLANRWERMTADPVQDECYFMNSWKDEPLGDIIVSHCPPHGYLDLAPRGQNIGSPGLTKLLETHTGPELVVCGHVHESIGFIPRDVGPFPGTRVYNVATTHTVITLGFSP